MSGEQLAVIGIGKLGLCFSLVLTKAGYRVTGVDTSPTYIDLIKKRKLKSSEPGVEELLLNASSCSFTATTDISAIYNHEIVFCVVATPSLKDGKYDHSQIDRVIEQLEQPYLKKKRERYDAVHTVRGAIAAYEDREQHEKFVMEHVPNKHFVICCTTMPGYCDSIKDRLARIGYSVSYNPEFIAQGTIIENQLKPDMVLIGEANKNIGDMLEKIYKDHTTNEPRICRMTPLEAEITKLSLNCFLTTKIAYANMIGDIVTKAGGRPKTVLAAIGADSRIGDKYLGYGYGYGGPCFPRDNRALGIYAGSIGEVALISEATDRSNNMHAESILDRVLKQDPDKKYPVVFSYVTYKKDSVLLVESQQLKLAKSLAGRGYTVIILDEREEVVNELETTYPNVFQYGIQATK